MCEVYSILFVFLCKSRYHPLVYVHGYSIKPSNVSELDSVNSLNQSLFE